MWEQIVQSDLMILEQREAMPSLPVVLSSFAYTSTCVQYKLSVGGLARLNLLFWHP